MHLWAEGVLVLCVVVLTAALLPAIAAVRRAAERGERLMALVENDVPPLVSEVREITKELSALTRDARGDVERIGAILDRAHDVADGLGRVVGVVAGFTRAGQVVGLLAGLRTAVAVVLERLRKPGDGHEQRAQ
jgi:uncharacterized protein YoxC